MGFAINGTAGPLPSYGASTTRPLSSTTQACGLIDSDGDGKINFAICQNVLGSGADGASILYNCSDTTVSTCGNSNGSSGDQTHGILPTPNGTACVVPTALVADPFDGVANYNHPFTLHNDAGRSVAPNPIFDLGVNCTVFVADLLSNEISAPLSLVNMCTSTSDSPTQLRQKTVL